MAHESFSAHVGLSLCECEAMRGFGAGRGIDGRTFATGADVHRQDPEKGRHVPHAQRSRLRGGRGRRPPLQALVKGRCHGRRVAFPAAASHKKPAGCLIQCLSWKPAIVNAPQDRGQESQPTRQKEEGCNNPNFKH